MDKLLRKMGEVGCIVLIHFHYFGDKGLVMLLNEFFFICALMYEAPQRYILTVVHRAFLFYEYKNG